MLIEALPNSFFCFVSALTRPCCKTRRSLESLSSAACPSAMCASGGIIWMAMTDQSCWVAGKPPSAFPQDRLHIDFSQEVTIGRQLAGVVDGLLEPLVEDRLTAGEALDMLTPDTEQTASSSDR